MAAANRCLQQHYLLTPVPAHNDLSLDINRLGTSGVRWPGVAVTWQGNQPLPAHGALFQRAPEVLNTIYIAAGLMYFRLIDKEQIAIDQEMHPDTGGIAQRNGPGPF